MDTSFEDGIRRAAGLPTASEAAAEEAAKARGAQALADDQPRRRALQLRFGNEVRPLIDQIFRQAAAALEGSDIRLVEDHVYPSDLLADKAYVIELTAPQDMRRPVRRVSPLHFSLDANEQITAAAPDVSSAPPTLRIGMSAVKKPMAKFTQEVISGIFMDYVKTATRVIRSPSV